jgi:hypothetical protein
LRHIALGAGIWTDYHDSWAEILDEVPSVSGDGEEISVFADVAEEIMGGVMLEQKIHFNADAADVLEHG